MDGAHLHLLLNHSPLFGCLFGILVLAWGLVRHQTEVVRAGLLVLVLAALLCIPTLLTGDGAEEAVEHLPGITRGMIHEHEHAAELSFWVLQATGVVALLGLLMPQRQRLFSLLALVGAVGSFALLGRTNNLGGQIRHTEIRTASFEAEAARETSAAPEAEDHD